jgi:hypothetical protein
MMTIKAFIQQPHGEGISASQNRYYRLPTTFNPGNR